MRAYFRYRYRNKVRGVIEYVFQAKSSAPSRAILWAAYGLKWRSAVNASFEDGAPPEEAAVIALIRGLEVTIARMPEKVRLAALESLRSRSGDSDEANNLVRITDAIGSLEVSPTYHKWVNHTVVGALSGLFGEDLQNYVMERQLRDIQAAYLND